jgi:hypothetical protein
VGAYKYISKECVSRECASRDCASRECASRECVSREYANRVCKWEGVRGALRAKFWCSSRDPFFKGWPDRTTVEHR